MHVRLLIAGVKGLYVPRAKIRMLSSINVLAELFCFYCIPLPFIGIGLGLHTVTYRLVYTLSLHMPIKKILRVLSLNASESTAVLPTDDHNPAVLIMSPFGQSINQSIMFLLKQMTDRTCHMKYLRK